MRCSSSDRSGLREANRQQLLPVRQSSAHITGTSRSFFGHPFDSQQSIRKATSQRCDRGPPRALHNYVLDLFRLPSAFLPFSRHFFLAQPPAAARRLLICIGPDAVNASLPRRVRRPNRLPLACLFETGDAASLAATSAAKAVEPKRP